MNALKYDVIDAQVTRSCLERELEGVTVDFSSSHLEALLCDAATPAMCDAYFGSRGIEEDISLMGQWSEIPLPGSTAVTDLGTFYDPLIATFESILAYFNLAPFRQVRDTHVPCPITVDGVEILKEFPDILIAGSGKHLQGSIQDDKWQQCIATVEVKAEKCKYDNKEWIAQAAHYARQCLIAQPTRMFAYGLLVTERHVKLYSFDRCGAQQSPWMDYRENPKILIQILLVVCNSDPKKIGVDPSVSFIDGKIEFIMMDSNTSVVFTADPKPRFQVPCLRGRATVCWSVKDKGGSPFLLKQQFVSTSRQSEEEILKQLRGKHIQGAVLPLLSQRYNLVSVSRGMEQPVNTTFHDRYMNRLVLDEHGDTIDNVPSRMALLVALRDAVIAHRNLWNEKILHRDVSTNNILYTKTEHGKADTRGVLIDFDISSDMTQSTSKFKADCEKGTRAFQSYSVLTSDLKLNPESNVLHDYQDDLESFYWVFIWITRGQVAPEQQGRTPLDERLEVHKHFEAEPAYSSARKLEFLVFNCLVELQPGWGPAYLKLAKDLGSFLHALLLRKTIQIMADGHWLTLEALFQNAPAHYEEFLSHFDVAIAGLKQELRAVEASQDPRLSPPTSVKAHQPAAAAAVASSCVPILPITFISSAPPLEGTYASNRADDGSPPEPIRKTPETISAQVLNCEVMRKPACSKRPFQVQNDTVATTYPQEPPQISKRARVHPTVAVDDHTIASDRLNTRPRRSARLATTSRAPRNSSENQNTFLENSRLRKRSSRR